jgi:hypothetical protein
MPNPRNVMGVITRTVDIIMRERVERDMANLGDRASIALVQPEIERGPGVGDLRYVSSLIERGEAFAEEVFDRCFDRRGRVRPGVITSEVQIPVAS